jgi:HPr kinase/phosphorylase
MRFAGQIHASCVAREGEGVLLLGPSGVGKSDLALRLIDQGFCLVADDRVDIADGIARAPSRLAGLLEVRGLGIFHLPWRVEARLVLAVELAPPSERLPAPRRHAVLDLPLVILDPGSASAAFRVALALEAAMGRVACHAGAFAGARDAA